LLVDWLLEGVLPTPTDEDDEDDDDDDDVVVAALPSLPCFNTCMNI
jgi:hypothetical protein